MRKKVLLVEDNTELLELLRLSFQQAGFSTTTAADGAEALKKARAIQPDAIVLDLVLPELDGFAVCEALRKQEEMATVPIVVLTGLTSEFTRYAGLEAGASEYVTKPASPDHLVSRIKHWLREGPAPAQPESVGKATRA